MCLHRQAMKRRVGERRTLLSSSLPPHAFSPLSPHHTQQDDVVLAGNPLVEVDVAQVLGGLLRSTDFLVIVDHPPATGRRGAQGHHAVANTQLGSPHLLSSPTPLKTSQETREDSYLKLYLRVPLFCENPSYLPSFLM